MGKNSPSTTARRRWAWVAGAAVVALVIGAGVVGFRQWRASEARATSCAAIREQADERGEIVTIEGTNGVHIAILGDSYSSGDGLPDWRDAWPYALQEQTGATVSVAGIGMTGFVNAGFCEGDEFGSRATDIAEVSPDLVIIQGGINDWQSDADSVTSAATSVISSFDAPVIVVGPADSLQRPEVALVDSALRQATADTGATYVSMLDEPLPMLPDQVHLTGEGHRQFAALVAEAAAQAT